MWKRIAYVIIFSVLFSGCYLFRPKNKCNDCPSWNKKGGHANLRKAKQYEQYEKNSAVAFCGFVQFRFS
jgi:hypothetical protein